LFLDLPAIPGTSNRAEHNGGKVIIGPDEDDDNVYVGIGEVGGRRTQAENVVGGPSPDGTGGY
jgi:aldose sugar dehydrogenase